MSNCLSKMLSPRAVRYTEKTSAWARSYKLRHAIAANLAAAALEEAFNAIFFSPSVCQMRDKDEPRCGSDVFLCGFNRDQQSPGCVCLGEDEDDDAKSANSSTYGGGCRRICRFCKEECSCWNYNSDHEVVCEECEGEDEQ